MLPLPKRRKRPKRSKHNATLREDDAEAVDTVTHTSIEVITKSGERATKRIRLPLETLAQMPETFSQEASSVQLGNDWGSQEPDPVSQQKIGKVRKKIKSPG